MLKRIFSILLIGSLIGPYIGISLYLKHEKKMLKREIKHKIIEGIDRSELVELTFTLNEAVEKLRWEHSKEFEYNGEMYDVVEMEEKSGTITYWCWWDHKETSLNKQLNGLLAKALNKQDPKAPSKNASFWMNLMFLVPDKHNLSLSIYHNLNEDIFSDQNLFVSRSKDTESPPPRG